jgi:hypothetical protein
MTPIPTFGDIGESFFRNGLGGNGRAPEKPGHPAGRGPSPEHVLYSCFDNLFCSFFISFKITSDGWDVDTLPDSIVA